MVGFTVTKTYQHIKLYSVIHMSISKNKKKTCFTVVYNILLGPVINNFLYTE